MCKNAYNSSKNAKLEPSVHTCNKQHKAISPFTKNGQFLETEFHKSSNLSQSIKWCYRSKIRLSAWLRKRSGGLVFVRHDQCCHGSNRVISLSWRCCGSLTGTWNTCP